MASARRKPRAPKHKIAGSYDISTGTAALFPDADRDGGYLLEINNLPSSYVVVGAPRILEFEYMSWIANVVLAAGFRSDYRALHLGGAACSVPRALADIHPESAHTVIEVDARLAELVPTWFDFPDSVRIEVAEARTATHARRGANFDLLVRDVFAGPYTPDHLTTVEFFAAARDALRPGGWYVSNCGDYPGLPTARRELAGMREVFRHVAAVGPPDMLAGREYGNIVLIASDSPLTSVPGARLDDWVTTRIDGSVPRHD